MEELALHYFPFPHVFQGKRHDGFRARWAPPCSSCDRQCESSLSSELSLCSYGVNFIRVDEDLLIAGVVVRDYPVMTSARRKAIRAVGKGAVSKNEIQSAIDHAAKASKELEERFRRKQDELIAEYRDSKGYQAEIVEQLRPDIERALAQVHDYKQFVQQIVQNVNVILSERYPGENIDAQLAQATHEEVAIYWAARLMEEKLDAVLYVRYPERILEAREWARFRFHGLVH